MMFDFRPLLSPSFWFDMTPDPLLDTSSIIIRIGFWGMVVLGVIARFGIAYFRGNPWNQKIARRVSQVLLSMGVFGLFLYWFSYERFPFLSMRFWYLVWLSGAVVWFVFLFIYILRTIPGERRMQAERKEKAKYLP